MNSVGQGADGAQRILFPLDDTAVWLCSRVQRDDHWLLAGPREDTAELALNKYVQTQAAISAGLNVPKTLLAHTANQINDFAASEGYPIILRPAKCVSTNDYKVINCGKWTCANRGELDCAIAEWAERVPLIAQPFVAGYGEGVFGIAASDGIRAWSGHRRLRMMNPQGSGSSACISQSVCETLKSQVEVLIGKAKWQGLFMIELLRDHLGKVWFIELNGRPWGSMALSRRQGLEYPAWHVTLAVDPRSQAGKLPTSAGTITCRNVGRELMHVLFVLKGPKSAAMSNWPSFWKTVGQVIRFRRTDTIYNWRRDDPTVFIADCYYTVHDQLFKS